MLLTIKRRVFNYCSSNANNTLEKETACKGRAVQNDYTHLLN